MIINRARLHAQLPRVDDAGYDVGADEIPVAGLEEGFVEVGCVERLEGQGVVAAGRGDGDVRGG